MRYHLLRVLAAGCLELLFQLSNICFEPLDFSEELLLLMQGLLPLRDKLPVCGCRLEVLTAELLQILLSFLPLLHHLSGELLVVIIGVSQDIQTASMGFVPFLSLSLLCL